MKLPETPEITLRFQSFLHADQCGVLLLFRYLAEFGWIFGLQNLFLPIFGTLCTREDEKCLFFRHENFCCIDSFDIGPLEDSSHRP